MFFLLPHRQPKKGTTAAENPPIVRRARRVWQRTARLRATTLQSAAPTARSATRLLRSLLSRSHRPPATRASLSLPPAPPIPPPVIDVHALQSEVWQLRERLAAADRRIDRLRRSVVSQVRLRRDLEHRQQQVQELPDHLLRELSALAAQTPAAVQQVVDRVCAVYGLPATRIVQTYETPVVRSTTPVVARKPARAARRAQAPVDIAGWPSARLEDVTQRAMALRPEIASRRYIHSVLLVVSQRSSATIGTIARDSGFMAPLSQQRVRLAAEALLDMGVLITTAQGRLSCAPTPARVHRPPHRPA